MLQDRLSLMRRALVSLVGCSALLACSSGQHTIAAATHRVPAPQPVALVEACGGLRWRPMAPADPQVIGAPGTARPTVVSTPSALVALTSDRDFRLTAAAYDVATDVWRSPEPASAPNGKSPGYDSGSFLPFAVGELVIAILGGDRAAAYDVAANVWKEMQPPPPIHPAEVSWVSTAARLFQLPHRRAGAGAFFDVAAWRWLPLPTTDAPTCSTVESVTAVSDRLVVYCGHGPAPAAILDANAMRWEPIAATHAPSDRAWAIVGSAANRLVVFGGVAPAEAGDLNASRLTTGGVYDIETRQWTLLGESEAPKLPNTGMGVLGFAAGATVLAYPALPRGGAFYPHTPGFVSIDDGRWRSIPGLRVSSTPVAMPTDRFLFAEEPSAVIAEFSSTTACTVPDGSIPFLGRETQGSRDRWSRPLAIARVGAAVVLWGRIQTQGCPQCPPGAPCIPCAPRELQRVGDGVVLLQ